MSPPHTITMNKGESSYATAESTKDSGYPWCPRSTGQFGEGCWEPMVWVEVSGEFIVAAADALHEACPVLITCVDLRCFSATVLPASPSGPSTYTPDDLAHVASAHREGERATIGRLI